MPEQRRKDKNNQRRKHMLPQFNAPCVGHPIDGVAAVAEARPHREILVQEILTAAQRWEDGVDFTANPDPRSPIVAVEVIGLAVYIKKISDELTIDMNQLRISWPEIEKLEPTQETLQDSLRVMNIDTALERAIEQSLRLLYARLWWNTEAVQRLAANARLLPLGVKMLAQALYFESLQKHAGFLCRKLELPDLPTLQMGFNLSGLSSPGESEIKSKILKIVEDRLSLSRKPHSEDIPTKISNIATAICMREMDRRSRELFESMIPTGDWNVLVDRAVDAELKVI